MTKKRTTSRRKMLGLMAGAAVAGVSVPTFLSCNHSRGVKPVDAPEPDAEAKRLARSPNEQIGVGIIGCGRRNGQLMIGKGGQGAPPAHARIVAVADLNLKRAQEWGRNCRTKKVYQDYRELLDQKEVDVVVYATPEHWHYLPCIHACQAGKDMYGEQPLSHTIAEGRKMVQAVRRYNRIFQTGEQQRSHPATRKAVELIRNGRIGKIQRIIGYNYPSAYECDFPARPIPEWLDWDRWCGPNEVVPYHTDLYLSRIPYNREPPYYSYPAEQEGCAVGPGWMSFRPYSGGELPNWGCHGLSMVHWALDMDESGPVEIWVDPAEKMETVTYHTPETPARGDALCSRTFIHYKYRNGVVLSLTSRDTKLGGGATFVGENGNITIFRGGYECDPVGLDEEPLPSNATRVYESDNHMENFFDCVVTRKDPIMKVEAGHSVATLCHLGNIARQLGRRLHWDPTNETFVTGPKTKIKDEEANTHLDFARRAGYELPAQV